MTEAWPWLALAGLGAFHGLNPAMGWLFAVALGLHRESRSVVLLALLPIAAGHLLSIATVAGLMLAAGYLVPYGLVRTASGLLLIAWAIYHWSFGHRHRVRFGLQTGLAALAGAHAAVLLAQRCCRRSRRPDRHGARRRRRAYPGDARHHDGNGRSRL